MVHQGCHCVYDESGIRYCDSRELPEHTIEQREWPVHIPCPNHQSSERVLFGAWYLDRASEFENESYLNDYDGNSLSNFFSSLAHGEGEDIGELVDKGTRGALEVEKLALVNNAIIGEESDPGMWSKLSASSSQGPLQGLIAIP